MEQLPALQELWKMARESPSRFRYLILDEQVFFVASSKLKKSWPSAHRGRDILAQAEPVDNAISLGRMGTIITAIDDLERTVESAPYYLFGKVWVRRTDFISGLTRVEVAVAHDTALING